MAAELAFGLPGAALGPVAITLPDGGASSSGGRPTGSTWPTTAPSRSSTTRPGRPEGYGDLSEENPDAQGSKLQLAVYGQAARLLPANPEAPVRAEYWFVSAKGRFERIGYP